MSPKHKPSAEISQRRQLMRANKKRLLVIAHPDDETIFFTGALLGLTDGEWAIACVTDGNADGKGERRRLQFEKACSMLKAVKTYWFGLPDKFEKRIDLDDLTKKLAEIASPDEVYTHGPIGEYMHPHHQDVCYAVANFFEQICPVFVNAYNIYPEKRFELSHEQFQLRTHILAEIYADETMRFINMLPAKSSDEFIRAPLEEIRSIYKLLTEQDLSQLNNLKNYHWLRYFLEQKAKTPGSRPF